MSIYEDRAIMPRAHLARRFVVADGAHLRLVHCAACGADNAGHDLSGSPRYDGGAIHGTDGGRERIVSCRCSFGADLRRITGAMPFDTTSTDFEFTGRPMSIVRVHDGDEASAIPEDLWRESCSLRSHVGERIANGYEQMRVGAISASQFASTVQRMVADAEVALGGQRVGLTFRQLAEDREASASYFGAQKIVPMPFDAARSRAERLPYKDA